jgi:hypothetical protein
MGKKQDERNAASGGIFKIFSFLLGEASQRLKA